MHGDGACLSTPLSRGDGKVVLRDQTEGRLQSLDWTSGLDWWTDTKNHFYAFYQDLLACRVMWKPCSLLSAHTVTEQTS